MGLTKTSNKLIKEKSPYLLQHAHNPVNWYPWSEEAFDKAKAEDKPIFLSIGYSTCHWCHVMERESFEDEEVAKILNKHYISIKVDREERPDVDSIYMSVCQALTGSGGWPLTVIMTPDKEPFFAGTYFPKRGRMGQGGLIEILEEIHNIWKTDRQKILSSKDKILEYINRENENTTGNMITEDTIHEAYKSFEANFDKEYGDFSKAPKFPTPHNLLFLMRYYDWTKKDNALFMVEKTLEQMYRGGIFDHIGFGFSRYSTDSRWLVPHFEKMLYDNALLAISYTEAYHLTKKEEYKSIANMILEYIKRDMLSFDGAFYSAEDADSEGEEGKFYIWLPEEIKNILGEDLGVEFCNYYDITEEGNFEGENIPNLINNSESFINLTKDKYFNSRKKLFDYRDGREHPYKDDKILTSWNGLMIAAFSYSGRVFENTDYIDIAKRTVSFINNNLKRHDGRLFARFREGEAAYPGYIDDYAFFIWGLIELYEACFDIEYLDQALSLTDDMIKYFYDKNGGFYLYGNDGEKLLKRPKEVYDGATPSGNSVAIMLLFRLSRLTGKTEYEKMAYSTIKVFSDIVDSYPLAYSHFLSAFMYINAKSFEITVVGSLNDENTVKIIKEINNTYIPNSSIVFKDTEQIDKIIDLIPYTKEQNMILDKPTVYICKNHACMSPITDINELKLAIGAI